MNSNIKIILFSSIALSLGLLAGYFLFHKSSDSQETHVHENTNSTEAATIWTCSMHPQISQNEAGDCPLCGMDLIPLEENTSNDPLVLQMTEAAVKLANIQTTIIGQKEANVGNSITLSGKIQADERRASSQVAQVSGRIEKLYVSFTGEAVRKGQKLADIYAPELITAQRELLEALKLQTINPKLTEAARNKLKYWKINEEQIKAIEENGTIQETFPLLAQASGVVTEKKVAVGDYIKQGEVLFDLINLNSLWVLFDAYEEDLASVEIGDKIEFTSPALSDQIFSSKITFIDPLIDPNTRVAKLRTTINNASRALKPEMLVYGKLNKNKDVSKTQLSVPKSAVLWTGKNSVVYVKIPNTDIPSYQFRMIEIGASLGDSYAVLEGLEAGEQVVTNGSFTIDAAAQLNNQSSMMNQKITIKGATEKPIPDYQASTPENFQQQLSDLTDAYIELKNALVDTDFLNAKNKVEILLQQLEKVEKNVLTGDALTYWETQYEALQTHTESIKTSTDIELQRAQFEFLSTALIHAITAFGTQKETIYLQHCPMASNNEGADWLSLEENIRNPYFGDKMMKCGVVKKQFGE